MVGGSSEICSDVDCLFSSSVLVCIPSAIEVLALTRELPAVISVSDIAVSMVGGSSEIFPDDDCLFRSSVVVCIPSAVDVLALLSELVAVGFEGD